MHSKQRAVLVVFAVSFTTLGAEAPRHAPPEGWTSQALDDGAGYVSPDHAEVLWISPLVPMGEDLERAFSSFRSARVVRQGPSAAWARDGIRGVMRQDVVVIAGRQDNRLGAVVARGGKGVVVFLIGPRSVEQTKDLFTRVLESIQLPAAEGDARSLAGDWFYSEGLSPEILRRRAPTDALLQLRQATWGILYSFRADGAYEIIYMTTTERGLAATASEPGRWRLDGERLELSPRGARLVIAEAHEAPWAKDEHPEARALTVRHEEGGGLVLEGPCAPWYLEGCGASGGVASHALQRLK